MLSAIARASSSSTPKYRTVDVELFDDGEYHGRNPNHSGQPEVRPASTNGRKPGLRRIKRRRSVDCVDFAWHRGHLLEAVLSPWGFQMTGRLALVTGANGHVGRNLIPTLIEQGWRVRASVRDVYDAEKISTLEGLDLEGLVPLDVRDGDAFRSAAQGVDVLFHVAATYRFHFKSPDAAKELVSDSLDGTRAAMEAAKAASVDRVVMTSSIVTLPTVPRGTAPPDESQWRTDLSVPYFRAKTEAEQLAWKLAEELDVKLVTILPGPIIGPNFGRGTQSTDFVLAIMKRAQWLGTVDMIYPVVDVRDVVSAHILAATANVQGRFYVGPDSPPSFPQLIRTMREIDPRIPRPLMVMPEFSYPVLPAFDAAFSRIAGTPRTMTKDLIGSLGNEAMGGSNARARQELGWRPEVPLKQSLADTMNEIRSSF